VDNTDLCVCVDDTWKIICHLALKDAQMKSIHYSQSSCTHVQGLEKYVCILFDDH